MHKLFEGCMLVAGLHAYMLGKIHIRRVEISLSHCLTDFICKCYVANILAINANTVISILIAS